MTEEEKIQLIRLSIGDFEGSPFYPLFLDEQLYQFLLYTKGDIGSAIRMAAISASMVLSGVSTREMTGDISVWNELSRNYLAGLRYLIDNSNTVIPEGLIPWSHSVCMDNLTSISLCDNDCHTFSWRDKCPTRQCTTAPCSCGG